MFFTFRSRGFLMFSPLQTMVIFALNRVSKMKNSGVVAGKQHHTVLLYYFSCLCFNCR